MRAATGISTRTFHSWLGLAAVAALAALLAACSGSTGSQGPQGPPGSQGVQGPAGTNGSTPAVDAKTATSITGKILSVTIASPPVVKFQLTDQNGTVLSGMPSYKNGAGIRFAIARLVPGTNGSASQWVSYFSRTISSGTCPTGVTCSTAPQTQGDLDRAVGTTTYDPVTGTYTYTFSKDITTDPNYDKTATHRVAFEIRGYAQANNGAYTFRPDGGTIQLTRDIVDTATCNNCHTKLALHGGARVETQYCVMCHSPQTTDYFSTNTVDFKVMVHKIHMGNKLPSLGGVALDPPVLGKGYWVGSSNFDTVIFPVGNDVRYCDNCHVKGLASAPDADNYEAVPTIEACGSCHDTVNFATGAGHSTNIIADNSQCTTCHGVNSNINNGALRVASAHVPQASTAAGAFGYVLNAPTFSVQAGGTFPIVSFAIVDPTNANKPYNILADAPFVGVDAGDGRAVCTSAARLAIDVAWDTSDYTNWGSDPSGPNAATWGQPVSLNPIIPGAGGVPATCALTVTSLTGGSGYVAGTYSNVPITGGSGTGRQAKIVVAGGKVTSVSVTTPGTGYVGTDVLSADAANLGGAGAGFAFSTLAYGGATVPAPASLVANTVYGPDATGNFTIVGPALSTPPAATLCADGTQCKAVQNVAAVLEGHPAVVLKNLAGAPVDLNGIPVATGKTQAQRITVKTAVAYGNTAGATPVKRRQIVDMQGKCDVCHKVLTLHGNNRNDNWEACVVCHNPASTDVSMRQGTAFNTAPGIDGLYERSIDFKYMIHGIHSAVFGAGTSLNPLSNPFVVYAFGGNPADFSSDAVLPAGADPGNCNLCHTVDANKVPTFYPGDPLMQATTTLTGLSKDPLLPATAGNPIATTPTMAACSGCHQSDAATSHMEQNGGAKNVTKDAEGRYRPGSGAAAETCEICHGPGRVADVATTHPVGP